MLKDTTGLKFYSVGDWPDGYSSWFDYETEMVGLADLVGSWKEDILKDIEEEFNHRERYGDKVMACSILTLWEGQSSQDWEGEWDFDYDYLGPMKNLEKSL